MLRYHLLTAKWDDDGDENEEHDNGRETRMAMMNTHGGGRNPCRSEPPGIVPDGAFPLAVVSGSGIALDSLFDNIAERIPFEAVPGLPRGGVPGHAYEFIRGDCAGRPLILQCGRLHFYEGFDIETVARTVDVLRDFGARTVLFTAAAGGIKPEIGPGDIVGIEGIRLCWCLRWDATPGMLFPDFVLPGCDGYGIFQWVHGPCYETRAEIAAIQAIKADTVGMSVAPELARCRDLGLSAGLVACVANSCGRPGPLAHDEVVAVARRVSARLARLIRKWLSSLPNRP